jgi:hypothetical protein
MNEKISREEARQLGQEKVRRVPKLTNKEDAAASVKGKRQKTERDYHSKRAVVLNFTRHSEPSDLYETLKGQYEYVRIFRPIDDGLFVLGTISSTKVNPLVSNPVETTNKTKSQQINEWLHTYLTTDREGVYPLDPCGDYFLILPQKDSQIALEILTALGGIKNVDWFIVWSIYNENTSEFEISEIVSSKGVYLSWKKKAASVADITTRKKQSLLASLSQAESPEEFLASLSEADKKLIEYSLSKKKESNDIT